MRHSRRWCAFCAIILLGAVESPAQTPRFWGLSQGTVSSFNISPGGCAVSMLLDRMSAAWNNGQPEPRRMPSTRFTLVGTPATAGRPIKLDLRGASIGSDSARIRVSIGTTSRELKPKGQPYTLTAPGRMGSDPDGTPVTITLDLPRPSQKDRPAMLTLDTIDVSLPGCRSRGAKK